MSRSLPQSAPPCKAAAGLEFENSDSNSGACTSAFSRRQFPPRFTTSEIHSRDDSQPNANVVEYRLIPGIPIYIMTMICEMTASGKIAAMAGTMVKVIGTGWALTIVFLVLLYAAAGAIARKNPLRCLWNMVPAYLTGFSIASSSAAIPVTLGCCEKNGISRDIRDFVVPLCANIHMVGSAIKLMASTLATAIIFGIDLPLPQIVHFNFMFAIAAVAAPGVMCGVLMASVGFLDSILGLTPDQIAVVMTLYMALDGYGPAANVTGDGAVALAADSFFSGRRT